MTNPVTHTFLVGERLSLVDAATVPREAYSFLLGKAERAKYPHTFRYDETIVNQPRIKDALTGAELAATAQKYFPLQKDQRPKPEKPMAEPEPKAEKEEEPLTPAEPKKKNPLDDLPKSDFNLEDWMCMNEHDQPSAGRERGIKPWSIQGQTYCAIYIHAAQEPNN